MLEIQKIIHFNFVYQRRSVDTDSTAKDTGSITTNRHICGKYLKKIL